MTGLLNEMRGHWLEFTAALVLLPAGLAAFCLLAAMASAALGTLP